MTHAGGVLRCRQWLASLCAIAVLALMTAAPGFAQTVPEWAPNTSYVVGAKVTYQGGLYQCQQAHRSIVTWEPPNVPALFVSLGAGPTPNPNPNPNPTPDRQAPTAPTNTRVTATTTSSISIAWNASSDNVGVTGYDVMQNAAIVGSTTSTSFTSTGLAASTSYTYSVRAKDAAGNLSAFSNQVTGTTQATQPNPNPNPNPGPSKRTLVGYWHNFENGAGFIKLRDISRAYDVVNLSFGEPATGSTSTIVFIPDTRTSAAEIQSDIGILQRDGKKVVLSIGGANGTVQLNTEQDRQNFINSVSALVTQYNLNGIDVDFEGSSVILNPGDLDFRNPTTPKIKNLISALRAVKSRFGSSFLLTMAPETFYVQTGFASYGGAPGAYLPVIFGVRDILDFIQVQLYNTGTVLGLDGVAYASTTADFLVAMSDMLLTGFPVGGDTTKVFPALRPDQVVIGLPASPQAAGSGYTTPAEINKALNYLVKGQAYGGRYVLRNPRGYNNLRGVMTFSINWDRFFGFVFSNAVRPALNNLPATSVAAAAPASPQ